MNNIDEMSVNAIRVLSADAIQKAKSGHRDFLLEQHLPHHELWSRHMNHNPANPKGKQRQIYPVRRTWFNAVIFTFTFIWIW